MQLMDYLADVQDPMKNLHFTGFPKALELPVPFAKALTQLYIDGEKKGCEHGQTAFFRSGKRNIEMSTVILGTAISCQTDRTTDPEEFGDMHSHPSDSIGHVQGYSAHSLEDYYVFQYHQKKPVFIRFVSSGHWLYAVVFRQGLSNYAKHEIDSRLQNHGTAIDTYFTQNNPVGADWKKQYDVLEDTPLWQGYLVYWGLAKPLTKMQVATEKKALMARTLLDWKKRTTNYGPYMMNASIEYNKAMALAWNCGFYSALNSNTLELQAGPQA